MSTPPKPSSPQKSVGDRSRARSAARAGAETAPQDEVTARETLRERSQNVVLNSISTLKDIADDFRKSNRFFKYKIFVLGVWLVFSSAAVVAACPDGSTNSLDARLVIINDEAAIIYMIKNESNFDWVDVEIITNGPYRSTVAQIEPNGSITLSSGVLFDAQGAKAPPNFGVTEIVLKTGSPKKKIVLLKNSKPVE